MTHRRLFHGTLAALFGCVMGGCEPQVDPGASVDVDRALACAAPAELPPSGAVARRPASLAGTPWETLPVGQREGTWRSTYVPVDLGGYTPSNTIKDAQAPTVIYLNRTGATIAGNYDDASRNQSSVVAGAGVQQITIPAGPFSDAQWAQVVSCVKDEYARFNVQIVDQRPAGSGYFMAMFGGTAQQLNYPQGVGGVAPIDPNGCQTIGSAIVYIFSGSFGANPQLNCEIAAQEIAHAFSLDHELLASDPMTYLQYNGHKTFQDQAVSCGEYQARACICQRPSQNSVAVLTQHLGPAPVNGDTTPPVVSITSPANGSQRPEGPLTVVVNATDNLSVAKVTLHYSDGSGAIDSACGDNVVPCTQSGASYTFTIPGAQGTATLRADAVDGSNNSATSQSVTVTLTPPVTGNPDMGSGGSPEMGGGPVVSGNGQIKIVLDLSTDHFAADRVLVPRATVTTTKGSITGAVLLWTDHKGVVTRTPMCPTGGSNWSLSVQVALASGRRSFAVEASDSTGSRATSSSASFSVDN